jgi:hypothetical protein
MGQLMIAVCHKCKVMKAIGSFSQLKIENSKASDFFTTHKGHILQIIGDDGGWDLYISELLKKGYVWL